MEQDALWAMRERVAYEDWKRKQGTPSLAKAHTKPSGIGVQIDAMIQRLKDDGHSPESIARVLRLRADKLETP